MKDSAVFKELAKKFGGKFTLAREACPCTYIMRHRHTVRLK